MPAARCTISVSKPLLGGAAGPEGLITAKELLAAANRELWVHFEHRTVGRNHGRQHLYGHDKRSGRGNTRSRNPAIPERPGNTAFHPTHSVRCGLPHQGACLVDNEMQGPLCSAVAFEKVES